MNAIGGIPYVEACFDKKGAVAAPIVLPEGVTDLIAISHGWNSSAEEARELYSELFGNFVAVARPGDLAARRFAILGVIWPSKRFDDLTAGHKQQATLETALDRMKDIFGESAERRILDEAKTLVRELENKASARRAFADQIRSLLDPSAANREDASDTFFRDDGEELVRRLRIADVDDGLQPGGKTGFAELLSEFLTAAMNLLNFAAYYEMKTRAGTIGKRGLAPLIDDLAPRIDRIHLAGHSFGARLVTAAAANSATAKISTLILLQAAFSHNGFSRRENGFFRDVVDERRIQGAVLITHTQNDEAVGIAYPIASRINGDRTAALGDENDQFGGLGRNGAQHMEEGEVVKGRLLEQTAEYAFERGRFFNLEASEFILSHGDVTGKQVAHAMRQAVMQPAQISRY